ncbi:MAG: hypothetical protein QOF62_1616 [Pyrinomonadaceae bacterium]|jgi:hypothetical protein|nr:hypothetical protein [Pyrinomonadaceae bacterium]
MTNLDAIKLILTLVSGISWTIVYIDGIRIGFKHRSYAIPFYALALNFALESLYTYYGFQSTVSVQAVVNAVWLLFDAGILITYFKYGWKYFPARVPGFASAAANDNSAPFIIWSALALIAAFFVEYAFRKEFGVRVGAGYSAFLQNLMMSVLFIAMLVKRGSREGQSLTIAVSKWLGTLAPTILFGIVGDGGFPNGSFLIVMVGTLCSVFDLIYIGLLLNTRPASVAL